MWLAIFGLMFLIAISGVFYLFTRFQRFGTVRRLSGGKRSRRWLLNLIPAAIIACCFLIDRINTIIVILHLVMFWLIGDLIGYIIKKCRRNKGSEDNGIHPYYTGITVLVFTAVYLCIGAYLAYHVFVTTYDLTTAKDLGQPELKAVLFSDSHIGTTFDGEGFARHMKTIQAENPDIVLIAGDYVDDDSTREDMVRSCKALGDLKTAYGIYYVSGNHDDGYGNYRDFSYSDLVSELKKNNVVVLEAAAVLVNASFYTIGRKDTSEAGRLSASELTGDLDPEKYKIMLDHQPNDYEGEAASGVDLVLSGHTHGGQMLPVNRAGEWIKANDRTYGYEKRNDTEFIVSSGISSWAIKFKTGTKSEYVVLNISK